MSEAPDLLGPQGKAQLVRRSLAQLQAEHYALGIEQEAKDAEDTDELPPKQMPDGAVLVETFGGKRQALDDAIQRINDKYGAVLQIPEPEPVGEPPKPPTDPTPQPRPKRQKRQPRGK